MTASTYITLNELKTALNIGTADTVDDDALTAAMSAAAGAVTAYCDRYFGQTGTIGTPVARMYHPDDRVVYTDDLVSFSAVEYADADAQDWTSIGTAVVTPLPPNAATLEPAHPYTALRAQSTAGWPDDDGWVRITGVWGWPEVPSQIKQATLLQAVRLATSRSVPLGIVGGMEAMPMRLGNGLHPDARVLCEPYVRTNL